MSSHLLGCLFSIQQNLKVVLTALGKRANLLTQRLDLIQVGGLGKTFSARAFRLDQPRSELLDTSSVLSPELDIFRVLVALSHGLLLEVSDILGDPVKLILEVLGILRNLVSCNLVECHLDAQFIRIKIGNNVQQINSHDKKIKKK
jgi:hypothetical protein